MRKIGWMSELTRGYGIKNENIREKVALISTQMVETQSFFLGGLGNYK